MSSVSRRRGMWQAFGPGILFAAAAVGVSHLVQSTRAGASFGLGLVVVIVVANLIKYPAFRFGPHYAAATGTSLLEGYRRQGRWALILYGLLTAATMFTVQAAVTVVTAALAIAAFKLEASAFAVSLALTLLCAGLLAVGQYRWLDRLTKGLVAVLTVSTVAATALCLGRVDWASFALWPANADAQTVFFVAALVGWMPSAIDVSVWQSLWTVARRRDSGHTPSLDESSFDFHVGYLGTVLLALCFVLLGAGIMFESGTRFADSAGAFAGQVVDLYVATLGSWSRPLIAASAFAVMFSTTLTVVDGFPRALSALVERFRQPEVPDSPSQTATERRVYWLWLFVMALGALLVIRTLLSSLKTFVDIATTLSFLTAPLLSWLNHRAVTSAEVPAEARPRPWLLRLSWLGIAVQGLFALYYLWLRYVGGPAA